MAMSGPTSATFEDSDEDLVQGPVTRSRGKLLENLGSLISLSKRSVTFADSNERKPRTSTKGEKKRQSTSTSKAKKTKKSAGSGFLASIETNSGKVTREKSGWETVRTFTSEEEFEASTLAKELR